MWAYHIIIECPAFVAVSCVAAAIVACVVLAPECQKRFVCCLRWSWYVIVEKWILVVVKSLVVVTSLVVITSLVAVGSLVVVGSVAGACQRVVVHAFPAYRSFSALFAKIWLFHDGVAHLARHLLSWWYFVRSCLVVVVVEVEVVVPSVVGDVDGTNTW